MVPGPLIILSGPSGAGKSTVVRELIRQGGLPLRQSISATTRPPRPGEVDGVDYHFRTEEEFRRHIAAGDLLEWACVYGNYYGTLASAVEEPRRRGEGVVLVIDVQGAAQVRGRCPDHVSIFLTTSTPEILEQRLRGRGTEEEETLQVRLQTAQVEQARSGEYQHVVYNDDLDQAVRRLREVIAAAFRPANPEGHPCTTS